MSAVVPLRSESSLHALARSAPSQPELPAGVDDTLGLIAQAAETIRRLQEARDAATAKAEAAFDQIQRDRADWQPEWERLTREARDARRQVAASELQFTEARAEIQAMMGRLGEAQEREEAAIARAEQAEARARSAEEWLSRLRDTVVSEFSPILDRDAP